MFVGYRLYLTIQPALSSAQSAASRRLTQIIMIFYTAGHNSDPNGLGFMCECLWIVSHGKSGCLFIVYSLTYWNISFYQWLNSQDSLCGHFSVFERVQCEIEVSVRKRLPAHKLITSLQVLLLAFGEPRKCRLYPLCWKLSVRKYRSPAKRASARLAEGESEHLFEIFGCNKWEIRFQQWESNTPLVRR